MRQRGYTLIELILAVSAASLLLVGLVGLFGRVIEMSRETNREQIWLADDLTAYGTLDRMARLLEKSQPSSMVSEQAVSGGWVVPGTTSFTPDRIRFKVLPTSSDGVSYQKDTTFFCCSGSVGYNETGYEFRYNGAGYVEEIVTWWDQIPMGGSSATRRLTFANRPGVTIDTATHGTSWHFIKYAGEWLTDGSGLDTIPRSGWSNDGFTLPNGSTAIGNWYAGASGVRLQVRLNFPDRPSKTYTRYVSLPKPGINRLYDRYFDNKYLTAAAGLNYDSAVGSRYYSIGGYYPGYGYVGDIDRYNVASNSWSSDVHTLPVHWVGVGWDNRRGYAAATAYGNRIFVAGGINQNILSTNWFDVLNVSTGAWTVTEGLSSSTYAHALASDGTYVYIVGGSNGNTIINRYTISTGAWAYFTFSACCTGPGKYPSAAMVHGDLYIFGGLNAPRQVIKFETSNNTASYYATLPYDHRHGFAAPAWGGWSDEAVFLFSGAQGQRIQVFDDETDQRYWDSCYYFTCCPLTCIGAWVQPPISLAKTHLDDHTGWMAGAVVDDRFGRVVYMPNEAANYKTFGIDLIPPYF